MNSNSQIVVGAHGFNTTWKIDVADLQKMKMFSTEPKTVDGMPGVKWFLKCDPNYQDIMFRRHQNFIKFYLNIQSENDVDCRYDFRLADSSDEAIDTVRSKNNEIKEVQMYYCKRDDFFNTLLNKMRDGKVEVYIHASFSYVKEPVNAFNVCDGNLQIKSDLGLLLMKNNPEDFEIIVEDISIKTHKFILGAESPVFKKMFENDFIEAKENKVLITDFKHEIVEAAVAFCYRQDIEPFIKDINDEVLLLYFADKYDCQTLKPQMENQISKKLTKENLSFLASTADQTNSVQLRQACSAFVCDLIRKKESIPVDDIESFDKKLLSDIVSLSLK